MINEIIWPVVALGGLGLILGLGLSIASKMLAVKVDPKIEKVRDLLPGANCGGCGYPGCDGFAAALAEGSAEIGGCGPLSPDNYQPIASVLGVEVAVKEKQVARVLCRGDEENCGTKYEYFGVSDCRAAAMLAGGPSSCRFGCVGLLTCAKACPFGAIYLGDNGIAAIDEDKCTGCSNCVAACPKDVIVMAEQKNHVYIDCRNVDKGKAVKSVCKNGCIGCTLCVKKCPHDALTMVNNLPVFDDDKCTGCGVCTVVCPTDAMRINVPMEKVALIKADPCIGCGICKKACPTNAIKGDVKEVHVVNPDRCAGCGICQDKCPKDAIDLCDR